MQVEELVLRLRSTVDAASEQMPGRLDAIADLAKLAAGALVAAGAAMTALTVSAAHTADNVAKSARSLSLSVEAYQSLALAADLAGVSVEALTPAVATLSRQLGAAGRGSKEASAALAAVGLSAADASRPIEEVLGELLDGLAGIPEGAQRSAVAMALLGEQGLRMATLIEGGSDAIRAAREELEKSGTLISPEAAARAEAFVDSMTILQTRVSGVGTSLGLRLLPVGERVLALLGDMVDAGAPMMLASMDSISRVLGATMDGLATPLGKVVALIGGAGLVVQIGKAAGGLFQMAKALPMVGGLLTSLGTTLGTIGAGPLALAAAGVVALYLAIDDLIVWMQGGESVTGDLVEAFGGLMDSVREAGAAFMQTPLMQAVKSLADDLGVLMGVVWELAGAMAGAAWAGVINAFNDLVEFAQPLIDLAEAAGRVASMVGGAVADAAGAAAEVVGDAAAATADAAGQAAFQAVAPGLEAAVALRGGIRTQADIARQSGAGSQGFGGAFQQQVTVNVQGVTGEQVARQTATAIQREAALATSQAAR